MSNVPKAAMIVLAMTLLLVFASTDKAGVNGDTMTIQVINELEAQVHLHVHCKDKNHDIPETNIAYKQKFEFQCEDSFWALTDYYCSFVFLGKLHWFDIYLQERDQFYCANQTCTWAVKEKGPCLIKPVGKPSDECYDWNK